MTGVRLQGVNTDSQKYLASETVRLVRDWGVQGDGTIRISPDRGGSVAGNNGKVSWYVTYGARDIEDTRMWGIYEYKTVQDMLLERKLPVQVGRYPLIKGKPQLEKCSLDILAAHEVAHVIQYQLHDNKKVWTGKRLENTVKPHGPEWREIYAHLLDCVVEKWDPEKWVSFYFGEYTKAYSRRKA